MNVVIFGTSDIARCAYEYFTHDSDYDVVGFVVDEAFLEGRDQFLELPLVAFETVEERFPPAACEMFVALGSHKLNRNRTEKYEAAKSKGYKLASYVSSRAFVWPNVTIGDNAFILEDNTVQPFVEIGNNVTLWSGNHIGHSTVIEDNCFVTSQVVISGMCRIGRNSFLGVNAAVADTVTLGEDNFIAMGVNVTRSTDADVLMSPVKSEISKIPAKRYCKVKD